MEAGDKNVRAISQRGLSMGDHMEAHVVGQQEA